MKTVLLILALLVFAQSPHAAPWTPDMKKQISDQCVTQNSQIGEKAKPFCDCYAEKFSSSYNITQASTASQDKLKSITQECLNKHVR